MRVLYVTAAANGAYGLPILMEAGIDVVAVVTITPSVAERFNVSGYADVRPLCGAHGIPCIALETYELTPEALEGVTFDLIIVNGWNRLLKENVLARAARGAIGVHAGHPPIGLGRAPLVWNILLGHKDIEVYAFAMTPQADDGEILALRPVEITARDDVQLLYEKVMFVAAELLVEAVIALRENRAPLRQALEYARHYGKRTPEDGAIDFMMNETQIVDFVRAQSPPYPCARATLDGRQWFVIKAQEFDRFAFRDRRRVPGEIVLNLPSGVVVMTGGSAIWITEATVDGATLAYDERESLVGRVFDRLEQEHKTA